MRLLKKSILTFIITALSLYLVAVYLMRYVPYEIPRSHRPTTSLKQDVNTKLKIRYLGISGFEVSDGSTTILFDPVVTRPTIDNLVTGPIDSDPLLVTKYIDKADYIFVNHSHFDHSLDAAAIAIKTRAKVLGSASTLNLMRSRGVAESQLILIKKEMIFKAGSFILTIKESKHAAIVGINKPMGGVISATASKLWFWQYALDNLFYCHVQSENGASIWFHPQATHAKGEMKQSADVLLLGLSGQPYNNNKMKEILTDANPSLVVPAHFDNFFQPLSKGMSLLPVTRYEDIYKVFRRVANKRLWATLNYNETIYYSK